jgi:hypothetical protein
MLPTRRIVLALALCAVLAPAAHAQINLAWNNCITQATAAENIQYACDGSRNGTPFRLVPSFFAPIDLPQFVGIEMTIDIGLPMDGPVPPNTPPLIDWWRLGAGECRDGNLSFPVSLTGIGTGTTGVCRNPWVGANTGGGYNYNSTYLPNVARLRLAFARDTRTALTAGQQYVGGVIALDTFGDIAGDTPVCAGCCQPILIVLEQVGLYQETGAPGGDTFYLAAPETRQYVWWQQVPECPVPAKRTSWGRIKTTYR